MADEGEGEAPAYGTAPVAPSLAWTDMKRDEVKAFMKIDQVPAPPPRCCLRAAAAAGATPCGVGCHRQQGGRRLCGRAAAGARTSLQNS
jgi:hypothetical protein